MKTAKLRAQLQKFTHKHVFIVLLVPLIILGAVAATLYASSEAGRIDRANTQQLTQLNNSIAAIPVLVTVSNQQSSNAEEFVSKLRQTSQLVGDIKPISAGFPLNIYNGGSDSSHALYASLESLNNKLKTTSNIPRCSYDTSTTWLLRSASLLVRCSSR
jgi:hypothetical protein